MADQSPADLRKADHETLLDVMPTVFVALGGTGMEILLRLRRRILQHNWSGKSLMNLDEFPPARFVYFDTDTAEARESGKAGSTDLLATRVAFAKFETLQKKVDTAHYMAEVDVGVFPEIGEWLPSGALSQIQSEKGAGQVRSISRLLFFDQYSNFMSLMRTQAERVTQNVTNDLVLQSLGLKTENKLRVVVVGSSAGGTGSGSFIDVGYALGAMRTPQVDQLDLFLMLPGGYRDANKDRVFANTYAALSELEFAMRGTRSPPYVQRWNEFARPDPQVKSPYKNVFLFDHANVAGQQTGVKDDLFDMIADILFEDFGSSEFARKKRTVSVNQEQHKISNYFPPLPAWLKDGLSYSKSYSSVGQTTLTSKTSIQVEEHLSKNNAAMVRAFFGLALAGQQRLAKTEERDAFLQSRLRLRPKAFSSEYDDKARFEQVSITDFDLVDYLLLRDDKSSISLTMANEIDQAFADVVARIHDHKAWDGEVRKIVEGRQRDVEGRVGEGLAYGPKGMEIAKQRERFEAELLNRNDEPGSLRNQFYEVLDDQERGGLEYTIDLITKIQNRLSDTETGEIARLIEAEEAFARRANRLSSEQLQASIDRLQQAASSGFFSGGGRKAAENYLGQVRADLIAYLTARLRSIACREAISLLRSTIQFLGSQQGIDTNGDTVWSGLVGEFQAGRKRVSALLGVIDADTTRLQDALRRGDGGTFFVIEDKGFEIPQDAVDTQLAWAREAFESIGGSQQIFARLDTDDGRMEILSLLRSVTNRRLGDHRKRVPSITDALRQLPVPKQQHLIERLVTRAMPWISANFASGFRPGDQHYKMFIAVDGSKRFQSEFEEMIRSRLPGQTGISSVGYVESGVPGRIVCYCELSGIPLDVIAPIRSQWRPSYLIEQSKSDGLPVHNHKDYLRFPDPIVPNPTELDELRERMKFFLRAVMLGRLRFNPGQSDRPGADKRPGYEMEESRNHWMKVGDERKIRRHGFAAAHREVLNEQVRRTEGDLSFLQAAALIALSRWYADRVYTRKLFEVDGRSERKGGIGYYASQELAQDYLVEFQRIGGTLPGGLGFDGAIELLYDRVVEWTDSVTGSIDDVSDTEVERSPELGVDRRATEKRTVRWSNFSDETIAALLSGQSSASQAPHAPPAAPPPPFDRYWLYNAEGQVVGPFDIAGFQMLAQLGQLKGDMKVCPEGSQAWQTVAAIPALASLLRAPSPVAPRPPPSL